MNSGTGRLAVTVDLEFFDSTFLFRGRASEVPDGVRKLGIEGVRFIADLLERYDARGTFFVIGEVAEQVDGLIRELADRGHEIASHGYSKSHPDLRKCDDTRLTYELTASKELLEQITGEIVSGFRAPAFAMDDTVMACVAETGYAYDSSLVPSRRIPGFYGTPDAPTSPISSEEWFDTPGVMEYPIAVEPRIKLPLSGAWMRLLGRRYARWGVRRHRRSREVTVLYVHPWELVELPRYDAIPKRVYWRTGEYTRRTMERLVADHADAIHPLIEIHENKEIPIPKSGGKAG